MDRERRGYPQHRCEISTGLHQGYQTMETPDGGDRPLVQTRSLEEYHKEPNFATEEEPPAELTLYPKYEYKKEAYAWGMAIDLNACNRLQRLRRRLPGGKQHPVVGKEQVRRGREMHWLRVDPYYQGDREQSRKPTSSRCRACSARTRRANWSARCRRTVHSTEGLNDMVYNRCVGTRYCSNNCPYKVRRFNFLLFQDCETPQPEAAAQSRRHRAQPRRDGEVHLLRAAHQ